MKKNWILKFALFGVVAAAVMGLLLMALWNRLMPVLFGLPMIGYLQSLGLLLLSRILFGRFHGPGHGGMRGRHWRGRMMARWEAMSPEEREKFRQGMRGRCGEKEPAGNNRASG